MDAEAHLVKDKLTPAQAKELATECFGDMFKIVVDIERGVLAAGGMLHADAEELLLSDGSSQDDLWGANYLPGRDPGLKLEYTALINIRPALGNRDQEIKSEAVRRKVREVVERLIGPA